jgi:hypothetical protein
MNEPSKTAGSDSNESRFNISADDLRKYDWQSLLASCSRKECHNFYGELLAEAKRLEEANDDLGRRVHALLYVVASFHPNYEMLGNPYESGTSGFNGRWLDIEDLTDADLAALAGIVSEIQDPEYRARVADVLWVTKKDYKAAQLALDAFLESAARLKNGIEWPPYVERLDRAARLAAHQGFEPFEEKVVITVEDGIREFENELNSGALCLSLMSILIVLGRRDSGRYATLAERFAQDFARIGNWHFSESYWKLAERWHIRNKDQAQADRCKLEAAECNISCADAGSNQGGNSMFRAHWLRRGLEGLRRAKADPKRIYEIHQRLLESQKQSVSEMTTIEVNREDIPGLEEAQRLAQKKAAEHVRGLSVYSAIIRLADITKPGEVAKLAERYEGISEATISDRIFRTTAIDHFGRVTDITEPVGTGSVDEEAANQRKRLTQQARTIDWPTKIGWFIEPARLSIMEEHAVRRRDLHFLVLNNPFIPPGHEGIYIRGLQAGFYGDWLQATHLLRSTNRELHPARLKSEWADHHDAP